MTSPARILLAVARDPELRVSEIAQAASVNIRSAYRILTELVEADYLRRTRVGRRNHYQLNPQLRLRDPVAGDHTLGDLLTFAEAQDPCSQRASPSLRSLPRTSLFARYRRR